MSRRGSGEGAIYQRSDGKWCASVDLGMVAGKRRRHVLYARTRKQVAAKLREAQQRVSDGEPVADSRGTVGEFLDRWLTEALPVSGVKPTTVENYTILSRRHLIPALGRYRLDALTAADVQRFLHRKRTEGLSDRTVQLLYAVLRRALGQAVRWHEARRNVAALVDRPRVARREAAVLTPEEAQRLLDAAREDRLYAFYAVAMAVGLRRGEALALRWSDVDLDAATVRVTRTLSRVAGGGLRFDEPKSARSRRTVLLPPSLAEELRAHRARQAQERLQAGASWRDDDLVFPSRFGTPLDPRNALRAVNKAADRAGIGHVKLHTLRHTCASLLLAQGVHPRVVMETLGHAGIAITMDVYSHVMPQQQREAAERMQEALRW